MRYPKGQNNTYMRFLCCCRTHYLTGRDALSSSRQRATAKNMIGVATYPAVPSQAMPVSMPHRVRERRERGLGSRQQMELLGRTLSTPNIARQQTPDAVRTGRYRGKAHDLSPTNAKHKQTARSILNQRQHHQSNLQTHISLSLTKIIRSPAPPPARPTAMAKTTNPVLERVLFPKHSTYFLEPSPTEIIKGRGFDPCQRIAGFVWTKHTWLGPFHSRDDGDIRLSRRHRCCPCWCRRFHLADVHGCWCCIIRGRR